MFVHFPHIICICVYFPSCVVSQLNVDLFMNIFSEHFDQADIGFFLFLFNLF